MKPYKPKMTLTLWYDTNDPNDIHVADMEFWPNKGTRVIWGWKGEQKWGEKGRICPRDESIWVKNGQLWSKIEKKIKMAIFEKIKKSQKKLVWQNKNICCTYIHKNGIFCFFSKISDLVFLWLINSRESVFKSLVCFLSFNKCFPLVFPETA